jgi:D-glycero-alpha-D-manno-heptose-7-phosphate kinase
LIVVETPLRVSFAGGGTDFEDFYAKEGGAVLSTAIDRCIYVIVKERFDDAICVNYSKRERVKSVDELEHELVREAMRLTGVGGGIEITTLADIPSEGTGLGSSSAVTVGLLHALYAYRGELVTAGELAEQACRIEIDVLKKPIGKQDQYICAYGNTRFITFDGSGINVEKVEMAAQNRKRLNDSLLLFYTGVTRQASEILSEQKANIEQRSSTLSEMKQLAFQAKSALAAGEFDEFGLILHRNWELKKKLAGKISNNWIDEMYQTARAAGAVGGKITGAGGGGFLLLYCPYGKQDHVRAALKSLRELPYRFQSDGSKVIFNYRSIE